MTDSLNHKHIVLGLTGGIAVYKSATITSRLVQAGAKVDVVMTDSARKFIAPLTFQALTHRQVYTDLFDIPPQQNIPHIALADEPDLIMIAPATANTLAKIAHGQADNLLTAIALATPAPILLAPAMESDMWQHPATQANVDRLQSWGLHLLGPAEGRLASGAMGQGRMVEPEQVVDYARWLLAQQGDLAGQKILITAGGTREAIDPVRFITNHSSGKMGLALAQAARDRGAEVTLVSTLAFASVATQKGITLIEVDSAAQMQHAVLEALPQVDALIMAAAVADYRPAEAAEQKIKKSDDDLVIRLTRNDDILLTVAQHQPKLPRLKCVVGFAAETQNLLDNAAQKLQRKKLDMIAANDVSRQDAGFGTDTNAITLLFPDGRQNPLPLMSKRAAADEILDRVVTVLGA